MWWCDGLLDKTLGSVGMLTARQRGQEQRSTLNNLSSRQSSHRRIAHATLFPLSHRPAALPDTVPPEILIHGNLPAPDIVSEMLCFLWD